MHVKKLFSSFSCHLCIFDISASRQNYKNLIGILQNIKRKNLIAKFELCSFNTEGAFLVTDRQEDRRTSKNSFFGGLTSLIAPTNQKLEKVCIIILIVQAYLATNIIL